MSRQCDSHVLCRQRKRLPCRPYYMLLSIIWLCKYLTFAFGQEAEEARKATR